jgi:CubicO group peptidase (beta-lactamase class C family)
MNILRRRELAGAVLMLLLVHPVAALQDEREQRATGWVAAFNAGADAMATFRADNVASDTPDWREMFASLRQEWGQLEIHGVMIPEPDLVVLGVVSENRGRMRLRFRFDDAGLIAGLNVDDGPSNPLPALVLPTDAPRPIDALDTYLRGLAEQDLLSGSVLIATRGEVWFERAYGLASREFGAPNTVGTRFDVGSFNKDYTRLAIMQLLADERLALTDTVGGYLPDYPNERVRNEVTIGMLLEHRSGLGDYFTREWLETPMGSLREVDDYIPIWGPLPLEYEPGSREMYSNYGYTVLGAVIESITGSSYPEYVEKYIFAPAGMTDSGFFETDGIEPNVAVGYTFMDGRGNRTDSLRKNIYVEPARGGPWGKSYSTARDLFRFFDSMFTGQLVADEFSWLGSGWRGGIGLAGGGPGLSAVLLVEGDVAVIVLANLDHPVAENVGSRLIGALAGS